MSKVVQPIKFSAILSRPITQKLLKAVPKLAAFREGGAAMSQVLVGRQLTYEYSQIGERRIGVFEY